MILCEGKTWPEPAKEFIFSITHTNFKKEAKTPLINKYQLSENEVINYLRNHPPSVRTMLSSVTEQYMVKAGKERWIEKTPDHINYLELIRKYFPFSPIIRIIRDPHDVALSLTKVPWGSESLLNALIKWKQIDLSSKNFFSTDKINYTIYYEKLIKSPTIELKNLCHFLDEKFEEQMLNTNTSGKILNSRNVAWKAKASQPLDPSRSYAWKSELSPYEKRMAEAIVGDRIEAHGYDMEGSFRNIGEFFPGDFLAIKYQKELEAFLGADIRFWKKDKSEKLTVKVFFGDPSANGWIRKTKVLGFVDSVSLAGQIILDKVRKKSIYWIIKNSEDNWSGFNAYLLKKLLSAHKNNLTA